MSKNQRDLVIGSAAFGLLSLPRLLKQKTVVVCFTLSISDFGFRIADFLPQHAQIRNPQSAIPNSQFLLPVVGVAGFEPATLRLSSACSNQLSYTPGDLTGSSASLLKRAGLVEGELVEAWGFEPQTYSLQSYRSTN